MEKLGCDDRLVTFLKFRAYEACLSANKCTAHFSDILDCDVEVTIQPYRQTSMKHLKDGLCNGLAKQSQQLPFEKNSLDEFKSRFPTGILMPSDMMTFKKSSDNLCIFKNGDSCGCIQDEHLAAAFMKLYFSEEHTVIPNGTDFAKSKFTHLLK
eukprot:NODE_642_length_5062_cov_1.602861.p4 type:complete len:154 gc:universal NODE_642_length_5062_cov_1.602861:4581-5042(+)